MSINVAARSNAGAAKVRGAQPAVQMPVPATPQTARQGRMQRMNAVAAPAACLTQIPASPVATPTALAPPDAYANACTPAPVAAAAKQTGITAAAPPLTTPGALRRRGRLQCMAVQTQPETPVAAAEQLPRAALCTYAEEVAKEDGCTVDDLYGGGAVEPPSLGGWQM